jgi:hypothetical protein
MHNASILQWQQKKNPPAWETGCKRIMGVATSNAKHYKAYSPVATDAPSDTEDPESASPPIRQVAWAVQVTPFFWARSLTTCTIAKHIWLITLMFQSNCKPKKKQKVHEQKLQEALGFWIIKQDDDDDSGGLIYFGMLPGVKFTKQQSEHYCLRSSFSKVLKKHSTVGGA